MQYLLSSSILAILAIFFWVHPEKAGWYFTPQIWICICIVGCVGGICLFLRSRRRASLR